MRRSWWIIAAYILAISLPYVLVWLLTPTGQVFGGFILNPLDGNSYLAKMQEGYAGNWLFSLPYTANPGQPAFLFIFYLFLGHISYWLGLPVIICFHIIRIVCAFYFAVVLRKFLGAVLSPYIEPFPDWIFFLGLFGSGSGWLLLASGYVPTDFWVAEAYPFLSGLVNSHFPLGSALMLVIMMNWSTRPGKLWWVKQILLGILLSLIMPFGIPILAVILGICMLINWMKSRKLDIWDLLAPLGCGGLILTLQFALTTMHPQLANWNVQNQTITPPIWDIAVSFSPVILLIFIGIYSLRKLEVTKLLLACIVWALICIPMAYFPFNLQRRLLSGFYIPLVAITPLILVKIKLFAKISPQRIRSVIIGFSLITNVFILIISVGFTILSKNDMVFIPESDHQGLEWIKANTQIGDVILADENLSMYIPAETGRKVVYGHPFETINADSTHREVKEIYAGEAAVTRTFIDKYSVDYLFVRNNENNIVHFADQGNLENAYQSGNSIIYRVVTSQP